jgi:hypothetical protein
MRFFYAMFPVLFVAGIVSTSHAQQHQVAKPDVGLVPIVRASLIKINWMERCGCHKNIVFVLPVNADQKLVDALSELHVTAIDHDNIPYSPSALLPDGYIQLNNVSIVGADAEFKVTRGPIARPIGRAEGSCGTTNTFYFKKVKGQWVTAGGTAMVC